MSKPLVKLPDFHANQQIVFDDKTRFITLAAGRRFGKSWLARIICLNLAINHGKTVWWVSPTYNNVNTHWRATKNMVGSLPTYKNEQQKYMEFNYNGRRGSLAFKSGDRPDNLRGDGLDYVVVDEAAFVANGVWGAVLRPALSDKQGGALLISTPNGTSDWFHRAFMRGLDENEEDWVSYRFKTSDNKAIEGIEKEVEAAKRDLSDIEFRQEYLAEFVDYAGGVFFGLEKAAKEPLITVPYDGNFIAGIDLGRKADFSVISLLEIVDDAHARQVCIERFTDVGFTAQTNRIATFLDMWGVGRAYMEDVSISMPVVEGLQEMGLPVVGVNVGAHNKGMMVEKTSANLQRGRLSILNNTSKLGNIQIGELQAYEMSRSPNGHVRYNAKSGWHDDTVMALVMANVGLRFADVKLKQQSNPFY